MTFDAPSAGTAAVSINGTMQCFNVLTETLNSRGVVDLATQIVTNQAAPSPGGPGGQRITMRLAPAAGPTGDIVTYSNAINLAATRIAPVKRGANTFRYKIAINRMDSGTACNVFNVGLTVIFAP